jgi:hypothetical protein
MTSARPSRRQVGKIADEGMSKAVCRSWRFCPPLYGVWCQEALRLGLCFFLHRLSRGEGSFFVRPKCFFVPTAVLMGRRAQPRSRLAAGHRRRRRAAALTAASTARDFAGLGTKVRAWRRHDVIPGLGLLQVCGNNTASPCIRSGSMARSPNPSCTSEGAAQNRRDPSTKRSG